MIYKGIIFDMDGVVCDTNKLHYKAWKKVAKSLGIKHYSYKDNEKQRGAGRRESIKYLASTVNKVLTEEDLDYYECLKNKTFMDLLNNSKQNSIIKKSTIKTLEKLRQKNYKLALGSSSKNAKVILEKYNIAYLFDFVCDGSMVKKAKPDPEIFINCLNGLNLNNEECIIIEDSPNGIEASHIIKTDSVHLTNKNKDPRAKYCLKKLKDLPKLLN